MQDTFYGLHQFFIHRQSVFLASFNMEWLLPGHSCAKCNGGPLHLDFLSFWLDLIAV